MINLMFIKNISRLDTIRFESELYRDNYFSDRSIVTIESIYPPHFQNRIQVSIEDLSPSTKVNYLSLYFEDKYYYYFIDNITYINEGLYELSITMDTITTFLFDLNINSAILERYSIARWNNDGSINRDYIRENLSKGDFKNEYFEEINNNIKMYIFKVRSEFFDGSYGVLDVEFEYINNFRKFNYNDGCVYILLPLLEKDFFIDIVGDNITGISIRANLPNGAVLRTTNASFEFINVIISKLLENPYVIDAYVCSNRIVDKFFTFTGVYESDERLYLDILFKDGLNETANAYGINLNKDGAEYNYLYLRTNLYNYSYKNTKNLFNYTKNINIGSTFNVKYIPQLIDENYYKLFYGEKLGYTSYPLHVLKNNNLVFKNLYDITTNNRAYCIDETLDENDTYFTNIINSTRESLPIFSDALNNYYAINKGTLTTGVSLAKQNVLWNLNKNLVSSYYQNNSGAPLVNKYGEFNQDKFYSSAINYAIDIGDAANSLYNIYKKLQIERENNEFTPDTVKQGNFVTTDLSASSINEIIRLDIVEDLEYVAIKYEQYGYLVNKLVINQKLYSDFNERYYFNVVKFNNIDIELEYINSESLKQNIIQRLENGLRLWNNNIDYSRFSLDNVENKFIQ